MEYKERYLWGGKQGGRKAEVGNRKAEVGNRKLARQRNDDGLALKVYPDEL